MRACSYTAGQEDFTILASPSLEPQVPYGIDDFKLGDDEPERALLIGVGEANRGRRQGPTYSLDDSLKELAGLAEAAGLKVVGSMTQHIEPDAQTYLGPGKVEEMLQMVATVGADTIIVDGELSPRQLRNLSRKCSQQTRICDRTALILDIFKQRAFTKEGQLQVEYAATEYQLPRLTKMWTHLERQSGAGKMRGMGEKQIDVDRRLLRSRLAILRGRLEEVQQCREQYRRSRAELAVPLIALVGYTNAGKSCLMNALTSAGVFSEDALFATLDTTVRKIVLPSGLQAVVSDTVGFIQKLPPQLVAAFRATLDDIKSASVILHVVDCSHPLAAAQTEAVMTVLKEIGATELPIITVWNKMDLVHDPQMVATVAAGRQSVVCVSAHTGEGIPELLHTIEEQLKASMEYVQVLIPFSKGQLTADVRACGILKSEQHCPEGTVLTAHVPKDSSLMQQLAPHKLSSFQFRKLTAGAQLSGFV
ncbi:GTPase HflX [Coccomyxa sp. Obi]|nr:GTPase HflX [Coccomyxa sp. Obi]